MRVCARNTCEVVCVCVCGGCGQVRLFPRRKLGQVSQAATGIYLRNSRINYLTYRMLQVKCRIEDELGQVGHTADLPLLHTADLPFLPLLPLLPLLPSCSRLMLQRRHTRGLLLAGEACSMCHTPALLLSMPQAQACSLCHTPPSMCHTRAMLYVPHATHPLCATHATRHP